MISSTKSSGCIPQLTLVMGIVIVAVMAFQSKGKGKATYEPANVYSVEHTLPEWQSELDTLQSFQNVVGYQMSREQSEQWQLVVQRMKQRLINQLQPQIMAELKKDSTKPKSK